MLLFFGYLPYPFVGQWRRGSVGEGQGTLAHGSSFEDACAIAVRLTTPVVDPWCNLLMLAAPALVLAEDHGILQDRTSLLPKERCDERICDACI